MNSSSPSMALRNFPKDERFGLNFAIQESGKINSGYVAEGFKKKGPRDKIRFMNVSQGSVEECRYYLILADDLDYGDAAPLMTRLEEVSKLLTGHSRASSSNNH